MTVTEEALGAEPVIAVAERDTLPETGTAQHVTKLAKSAKRKDISQSTAKQELWAIKKISTSDPFRNEESTMLMWTVVITMIRNMMMSLHSMYTWPVTVSTILFLSSFDVDVNVDIGASVNMIDSKLWEELKGKKI